MPKQTLPINGLDQVGVIRDNPAVSLPPNAFSDVLNVRFKDGSVRKMEGDVNIFPGLFDAATGTASIDGTELIYVAWWPNPNRAPTSGYYIYIKRELQTDNTFDDVVYITEPTQYTTDMTNNGLEYSQNFTERALHRFTNTGNVERGTYQHTFFQGGFAVIINNGAATPIYITDEDGNLDINEIPDAADLPGWESYQVNEVSFDGVFNEASDVRVFDLGARYDFIDWNITVRVQTDAVDFSHTFDFANRIPVAPTGLPTGAQIRVISTPTLTSIDFNEDALPDGATVTITVQSRYPVDVTAGVVRAFGDFLVAGNLQETARPLEGTTLPTTPEADQLFRLTAEDSGTLPGLYRWNGTTWVATAAPVTRNLSGVVRTSDAAAPGAIPTNWNPYAAGVSTADEFVITADGVVQDMAELQGNLYLYSNSAISVMRQTGNATVPLAVQPITNSYGLQTTNAVLEFDGKHLVVGSNDIYLFGGHPGSIQSISDGRVRRFFFDDLNPLHEQRMFALRYNQRDEIWVCYPNLEADAGDVNRALIWNYRNNVWTIREMQGVVSGDTAPIPGGGIPSTELDFTGNSGNNGIINTGSEEVQTISLGPNNSIPEYNFDGEFAVMDLSVTEDFPDVDIDAVEVFDILINSRFDSGPNNRNAEAAREDSDGARWDFVLQATPNVPFSITLPRFLKVDRAWDQTIPYLTGERVIYNDDIYVCIDNIDDYMYSDIGDLDTRGTVDPMYDGRRIGRAMADTGMYDPELNSETPDMSDRWELATGSLTIGTETFDNTVARTLETVRDIIVATLEDDATFAGNFRVNDSTQSNEILIRGITPAANPHSSTALTFFHQNGSVAGGEQISNSEPQISGGFAPIVSITSRPLTFNETTNSYEEVGVDDGRDISASISISMRGDFRLATHTTQDARRQAVANVFRDEINLDEDFGWTAATNAATQAARATTRIRRAATIRLASEDQMPFGMDQGMYRDGTDDTDMYSGGSRTQDRTENTEDTDPNFNDFSYEPPSTLFGRANDGTIINIPEDSLVFNQINTGQEPAPQNIRDDVAAVASGLLDMADEDAANARIDEWANENIFYPRVRVRGPAITFDGVSTDTSDETRFLFTEGYSARNGLDLLAGAFNYADNLLTDQDGWTFARTGNPFSQEMFNDASIASYRLSTIIENDPAPEDIGLNRRRVTPSWDIDLIDYGNIGINRENLVWDFENTKTTTPDTYGTGWTIGTSATTVIFTIPMADIGTFHTDIGETAALPADGDTNTAVRSTASINFTAALATGPTDIPVTLPAGTSFTVNRTGANYIITFTPTNYNRSFINGTRVPDTTLTETLAADDIRVARVVPYPVSSGPGVENDPTYDIDFGANSLFVSDYRGQYTLRATPTYVGILINNPAFPESRQFHITQLGDRGTATVVGLGADADNGEGLTAAESAVELLNSLRGSNSDLDGAVTNATIEFTPQDFDEDTSVILEIVDNTTDARTTRFNELYATLTADQITGDDLYLQPEETTLRTQENAVAAVATGDFADGNQRPYWNTQFGTDPTLAVDGGTPITIFDVDRPWSAHVVNPNQRYPIFAASVPLDTSAGDLLLPTTRALEEDRYRWGNSGITGYRGVDVSTLDDNGTYRVSEVSFYVWGDTALIGTTRNGVTLDREAVNRIAANEFIDGLREAGVIQTDNEGNVNTVVGREIVINLGSARDNTFTTDEPLLITLPAPIDGSRFTVQLGRGTSPVDITVFFRYENGSATTVSQAEHDNIADLYAGTAYQEIVQVATNTDDFIEFNRPVQPGDVPPVINKILAADIGWTRAAFDGEPRQAILNATENNLTITGGDAPETYESYVERHDLAVTPEFDTEQVQSVAMHATGFSLDYHQGPRTYNKLKLRMEGSNAPGTEVDLSQEQTTQQSQRQANYYVSEDYKIDMRVHGRFVNLRLTDESFTEDEPEETRNDKTFNQKSDWRISAIQADIVKGGTR